MNNKENLMNQTSLAECNCTPRPIRLIALDLDGTLFDPEKNISPEDRKAVQEAVNAGIRVVISTGRPYVGMPFREMQALGIAYAVTVNGAAVYHADHSNLVDGYPARTCLYEAPMTWQEILPVIRHLEDLPVFCDVFIDGDAYAGKNKLPVLDRLPLTDGMKAYKIETRIFVDDLETLIRTKDRPVQKITLDFPKAPDGTRLHRDAVKSFLDTFPFRVVCGGAMDWELTTAAASKSNALTALSTQLGISMQEVMAIGDAGNDLDMIRAAGTGVSMANGEADVRAAADFITRSNTENGVAFAIRTLCDRLCATQH